MNSNSTAATSPISNNSSPADGSGKKVRKPYTITKSRESWTDEEHDKFLEALQLFDRDWKKIEDFVGSKTVIQIRSHAQKYFLKVQKNGTIAHVPPPRPKRKATHPYPQKAPKNGLVPMQASMAFPASLNSFGPGYLPWEDSSILINTETTGITPQDEYYLHRAEADIGPEDVSRMGVSCISSRASSSQAQPSSELIEEVKPNPLVPGIPDFAEVYGFIGSIFDPDTSGHVEKLKEMDPINFETVLLLMKNLSVNLSSPDFEPMRKVLSSYDVNAKIIGVAASNVCQEPEQ